MTEKEARTVEEINADLQRLTLEYGDVWTTEGMKKDFDVHGFAAPYVSVTRKKDGVRGTLQFQAAPRLYFNFQKE
jgi:hypothetical protein